MKKVVVAGIGLVTPLGSDKEIFWDRLAAGETAIDFFGKDKKGFHIKCASEVRDPVPDRYAKYNRAVQFALMGAASAIKDAGMNVGSDTGSKMGVVVSASKINLMAYDKLVSICAGDNSTLNDFCMYDPALAIMREFGITGPCMNTVTACSTGAHSISAGAEMIRRGEADIVIAGSAEASLTPLIVAGFQRMGVLANANGTCNNIFRPFDRDRCGFVIGEGAGIVILESKESASKRGANIYGEVSGWANAGDSYHITSFDPSSESISNSIRLALKRAELDTVDYVNCHGTATPKNDTIETLGIKKGFGDKAGEISISATKPSTGHLLGAGGSVEFILSLLAMEKGLVPPTLNLENPDTGCDLDYTPGVGVKRNINSILSLSYGFGGHIGSVIAKRIE